MHDKDIAVNVRLPVGSHSHLVYRFCNHCGSEFFTARDWVEHAIVIAKGYGHKDATWLRNATAREREMLGNEEYEHILAERGLK